MLTIDTSIPSLRGALGSSVTYVTDQYKHSALFNTSILYYIEHQKMKKKKKEKDCQDLRAKPSKEKQHTLQEEEVLLKRRRREKQHKA